MMTAAKTFVAAKEKVFTKTAKWQAKALAGPGIARWPATRALTIITEKQQERLALQINALPKEKQETAKAVVLAAGINQGIRESIREENRTAPSIVFVDFAVLLANVAYYQLGRMFRN